jgi:DNA-binding response OmpR family regulator
MQIVRRRLEHVIVELERYRREQAQTDDWEAVEQASQTALRALHGALLAVPTHPFDEVYSPSDGVLAADDLTVSVGERQAWYDQTPLPLSATEFALLVALMREPRRIYTKAELLRDVWDIRAKLPTRTLETHVSRLRKKLADAEAPRGRYVVCLWGVGYSLIRP